MPVGRQARRNGIAKRQVQGRSYEAPFVAVRDVFQGGVRHDLQLAELRLAGDVAHRAGFGSRAEQRALRAAQHLETIEVK